MNADASSAAYAAAVMQGFPPAPEARISAQNWHEPAFLRWSLMNRSMQVPSVQIWRGDGPTSPLPEVPQELDALPVPGLDGTSAPLQQVLASLEVDAFLVLHRGRIVYERYFHNMLPRTLHGTASVSKSFMAVLCGILQGQKVLDFGAEAQYYVPELRGTAMGDASLQQLLDMQAGIQRSLIAGRDTSMGQQDGGVYEILGLLPLQPDSAADFYEFVLRKPPAGQHGRQFYYDNGTVEALAWVVRRATGRAIADLYSEYIFAPLGAQRDAFITVDRLGAEFTAGGLATTLRDMARFGEMLRHNGYWNGRQIVPEAFVADTRRGGDRALFAASPRHALMPTGSYRNCFFNMHDDMQGYTASGRYGQRIYVSPRAELVVAQFSSAGGAPPPHPFDGPTVLLQHALAAHFAA
ncbi:serine hydrolase domain-containing protein [Ottowia thiooxydans]|uniref:CubicO group peptidase (Beta-lactamase class C family) n=1 Tax=Ottowia thiooxydans TaxID=219182 RepID=A0ABV2Q5E6_9BURK